MPDTVIEIEHLYKEYRLGLIGYGTLREDLQSWWARTLGKDDPNSIIDGRDERGSWRHKESSKSDHILALDGINLKVQEGEKLGIIGKNGAGKTTLLKILSRISSPTRGRALIRGKVASLIAVGTGFHPELTGRENVYLNGAILGLTKSEIDDSFDEIINFADLLKFIDTPVKRYSTGMYIRLGFSVAAHLDPDILMVDEVLAVGDYAFREKAMGKMNEISIGGRTILFVSHNLASIQELCDRVILLDGGSIIKDGEPESVINHYIQLDFSERGELNKARATDLSLDGSVNRIGNQVCLKSVSVLNEAGDACDRFTVRDSIYVEIEYEIYEVLKFLDASFHLMNQRNERVFYTFDDIEKRSWDERRKLPGKYISRCKIPGDFLNDGTYSITVALTDNKVYSQIDDAVLFQVDDVMDPRGARGLYYEAKWISSTVRPVLKWDVQVI